jgi:hypothetical protein
MKYCDHCNKSEEEQGNPIDCEVWGKDRDLLLCDDCFFNEEYKKSNEYKRHKAEADRLAKGIIRRVN